MKGKLFSHANVHRLLVLVICNAATTIQGSLNAHHFEPRAMITGTLAAAASAALGWLIGNMSTPDDASGSST